MKGILIDPETRDVRIKNGTVVIGDIEEQVAELVLLSVRGDNKEFPLIGGEIVKRKNGTADPIWCADAKRMLSACGLPVKRVEFKDGKLTIE